MNGKCFMRTEQDYEEITTHANVGILLDILLDCLFTGFDLYCNFNSTTSTSKRFAGPFVIVLCGRLLQ